MRVVSSALCAAALGMLLAVPAAAAPVGLIQEIPTHANVGEIAVGPEGNLWFTRNRIDKREAGPAIGRITPAGRVTIFRAPGFSARAEPIGITAGPDGNMWFTYDPPITASSGGGIGRITPQGKITLFPEPPELSGVPFEIVAGADGNLWFDHAGILNPVGQAIGRITTSGEISIFSTGLRHEAAVGNLTPGPDGNVWFGDDSPIPAIGRITPAGEITEFPGIPPREFTILEGPTPGPEGNMWFSANEPTPLVERITPTGTIERFAATPRGQAGNVGPFATGADGNVWFALNRVGPDENQRPAIGRITPSGQVAEFHKCLMPFPGFFGPFALTQGPDGDVWFATYFWNTGQTSPASIASIGRITGTGEITEFRLGLGRESEPDELVAAPGRIWFNDRGTRAIGTIVPSRSPANTFTLLAPRQERRTLTTRVRLVLPGPGRLRLRELSARTGHGARVSLPAARTIRAKASGCGPASISLVPRGDLLAKLRAGDGVRMRARITFVPRGGSAFSRVTTVWLRGR